MSDLQQEVQQVEGQSESETSTSSSSSNSDQDILGNSAVQEALGIDEVPENLSNLMKDVYRSNAERTSNMMVGLTEGQQYDVNKFLENWNKNKARYEAVSQATNMPPALIAALHWRESTGDFSTYLHQGDPLGKPAVHVPTNIPVFYEWEDAAIHALNMRYNKNLQESMEITADTRNPTPLASFAEAYNGLGYHTRGVASPYVYSGTDQYSSGKYVADGQYSSRAVDGQLGVMTLMGAAGGLDTEQDMSPQAITMDFAWRRVVNGQKMLRLHDNGLEVEALQTRLQQLGFDISVVDGDFGNGTKRAVIAFQQSVGETGDGVVGPGTAGAINTAIQNIAATATTPASSPTPE